MGGKMCVQNAYIRNMNETSIFPNGMKCTTDQNVKRKSLVVAATREYAETMANAGIHHTPAPYVLVYMSIVYRYIIYANTFQTLLQNALLIQYFFLLPWFSPSLYNAHTCTYFMVIKNARDTAWRCTMYSLSGRVRWMGDDNDNGDCDDHLVNAWREPLLLRILPSHLLKYINIT